MKKFLKNLVTPSASLGVLEGPEKAMNFSGKITFKSPFSTLS